jgi:hypothetical protein
VKYECGLFYIQASNPSVMSKSSEDNKSNVIRFDEREIGNSDHQPTRTAAAARHAQFELGDYNDSPRDEEMDGTADVYGSVPSDKRDMMRMGKDQELRVSSLQIRSSSHQDSH